MNIKSLALAVAMLAMPVAGSVSLIGGQAAAATVGGGGSIGGSPGGNGEYSISYPMTQTCLQYNTLNGEPQKGSVCKKAKSFINGGHFI